MLQKKKLLFQSNKDYVLLFFIILKLIKLKCNPKGSTDYHAIIVDVIDKNWKQNTKLLLIKINF